MTCPKCGNLIPNGQSKCNHCGYSIPRRTGQSLSFAEKAIASYALGKVAMKQLDHVDIFNKLAQPNPSGQPYVRRNCRNKTEK